MYIISITNTWSDTWVAQSVLKKLVTPGWLSQLSI